MTLSEAKRNDIVAQCTRTGRVLRSNHQSWRRLARVRQEEQQCLKIKVRAMPSEDDRLAIYYQENNASGTAGCLVDRSSISGDVISDLIRYMGRK